jgi:hypothetical protein
MPILSIIIVLVVVGVILWLINQYVPMEVRIKQLLNIVVIILVCVWLLKVLGIWHYLAGFKL